LPFSCPSHVTGCKTRCRPSRRHRRIGFSTLPEAKDVGHLEGDSHGFYSFWGLQPWNLITHFWAVICQRQPFFASAHFGHLTFSCIRHRHRERCFVTFCAFLRSPINTESPQCRVSLCRCYLNSFEGQNVHGSHSLFSIFVHGHCHPIDTLATPLIIIK